VANNLASNNVKVALERCLRFRVQGLGFGEPCQQQRQSRSLAMSVAAQSQKMDAAHLFMEKTQGKWIQASHLWMR
jgi:hypothetical protein